MKPGLRFSALLALAATALVAALTLGSSASAHSTATPTSGGNVVIARAQDSTSMDATSVFDNESIWVLEQIMEPLYTVTADGKSVKPWLATSYTLSPDKKAYTFKLRQGVKFHNGKEMTSADVKFSLDSGAQPEDRLGLHRHRDQERGRQGQVHRRRQHEVPVGSAPRRPGALLELHRAEELRRQDEDGVLQGSRRHRPVQVGSLDARQGPEARQVRRLLAARQAVPGQRDVDERPRREHAPAAAQGRPGAGRRVPRLGPGQAAAVDLRA